MVFEISVLTHQSAQAKKWSKELTAALKPYINFRIKISKSPQEDLGQVVLVDEKIPKIADLLKKMDRHGRIVFLLTEDTKKPSIYWQKGWIDDLVALPIRPIEILTKLKYLEHFTLGKELQQFSQSFSELVRLMQEDLQLIDRIHHAKTPKRFPNIKGFQVAHRYLAGLKSGGDYFDLAESQNGEYLNLIFYNTSSYGLSNVVLSILLKVLGKLSADPAEIIQSVYSELALILKAKDEISLFYGSIHRETQKLKFVHFGSDGVFFAPPGEKFQMLSKSTSPISKNGKIQTRQQEIQLPTQSRFVFISEGLVKGLGGEKKVQKALDSYRDQKGSTLLNEFVFQVKSQLETADDLPERDCTVAVFDAEPRVIRLAKNSGSKQERDGS